MFSIHIQVSLFNWTLALIAQFQLLRLVNVGLFKVDSCHNVTVSVDISVSVGEPV